MLRLTSATELKAPWVTIETTSYPNQLQEKKRSTWIFSALPPSSNGLCPLGVLPGHPVFRGGDGITFRMILVPKREQYNNIATIRKSVARNFASLIMTFNMENPRKVVSSVRGETTVDLTGFFWAGFIAAGCFPISLLSASSGGGASESHGPTRRRSPRTVRRCRRWFPSRRRSTSRRASNPRGRR